MDTEVSRFPRCRFLPPRPALSVPRPAVSDALSRAVEVFSLTLLVAPGGSGKTTAMAWWAAEAAPRPVVWARLDSQDDDALSVASLLLAALRFAHPGAGRRLEHVLSVGASPETHGLAIALANDLEELGNPVVAIDDLHTVSSPTSVALLDALLDNLPHDARLLAASRVEPELSLARRRVRGELAEFRADDLRLDALAVRAMLDRAGVGDDVSEEEIVDYSTGWAAAVRLAVMSAAAGHWSPGHAASALTPGVERDINDFFAREILDELPDQLRSFMLETSLLSELTSETCTAATGRGDAARLLEEVTRRDLFISGFGPDGSTCRYHDLLAAFLRQTLAKERTRSELDDLRRRAASCSPPGDALRLLLDAGMPDAAAEIVTAAGRAQVTGTAPNVPDSWLAQIPPAVRVRHPWIRLLAGLGDVRRGQMDEARHVLLPTFRAMCEAGDDLGANEAAFALAEALAGLGDIPAAQEVLDDLAHRSLRPDDRIRVLGSAMWHAFFAADWPTLCASLGEAFGLALGDATDVGRTALALALGTEMAFTESGPAWLRERCRRLGAAIPDARSPAGGTLGMMEASFAFLAGDLDASLAALASAAAVSRDHGGLGWLDLQIDRLRLAVALATGDFLSVAEVCEAAADAIEASPVRHQERAMYAYAMARRTLHLECVSDLVDIRDRWLGDVGESDRPDAAVTRIVIDACIARADGHVSQARTMLEAGAELHHTVRFSLMTGLPMLELAGMMIEAGDEHGALNVAREALDPIAAMDAPGLLLQEGPGAHRAVLQRCAEAGIHERLLTPVLQSGGADRPARSVAVPGTGERLTAREVEVLRRVAAGDSNRAIGEMLFIGERTVKTHMTSLMRKLAVSSRTQAVARARELGLLL